MTAFYKISRAFVKFMMYLLYAPKVTGRENYNYEGPCILIANHINFFDAILMLVVFPRHVVLMGKAELFKNKFLNYIFATQYGAFPVERGGADLNAIRQSLKALREGKALGIFPEGTRSRTGQMGKLEAGASLIALKAGVKVIPAYIQGPYRIFRRVKMNIGAPIDLAEYNRKIDSKTVNEVTLKLTDAISSLNNQIKRI